MTNQSHSIRVDVLVCTYKRPELLKDTLEGIENANDEGLLVRVIVVDNDDKESARELVESYSPNSRFDYIYLTQPVQNISITRNCALDAANGDYVALIDDDEVPEPMWIRNLVETAETYRARLVFGPVISKYVENIPQWIIDGRFFEFRARYSTATKISLLGMRTGNVLICGKLLSRTQARFDPRLGLSGGEDYDFFQRLVATGVEGIWCDEAPVHEWVPQNRATVEWLLKRAFRIGSVDGFSRRRSSKVSRISTVLLKGLALFIIGSFKAASLCLFSKHRSVKALQKLSLGLGMLYGVFFGPYSEYRNA